MKKSRSERVLGGHPIDVGAAKRDLLNLMCMYEAMPSMLKRQAQAGLRLSPAQMMFEEMIEPQTARILLSAAATIRMVDDQSGLADKKNVVGSLLEKTQEKPLSLREASNKLLHADEVTRDIEFIPVAGAMRGQGLLGLGSNLAVTTGTIKLKGTTQRGTPWSATLDISKFAQIAYVVLSMYADIRSKALDERRTKMLQALFEGPPKLAK